MTTLVVNRLRGGLKICAVKAPGFGDRRKGTHTGNHLLFYENSLMLGSFLGNLFLLYRIHINLGIWCVALVGIGFGIFLGSWVIALGEVVNVFAIMARRVGLTKGAGLVILSLAVGKVLGSLVQFFC